MSVFFQVFTVKLGSAGGSLPSSPDSSSDSSPPSTPQPSAGPNLEMEHLLPGVVSSAFSKKLMEQNSG